MEKDEKIKQPTNSQYPSQIVIPLKDVVPKMWICDVCGHPNPEYTAICKKCSNYIQRS